MKKCTLDELLKQSKKNEYSEQYAFVVKKINSGEIKPIKSAGTNGKKPALPLKYRICTKADFTDLQNELVYNIAPEISIEYYSKHLDTYQKEREAVQRLSQYLMYKSHQLLTPVSTNERSYEIWHKEKFLGQNGGKTLLRHCGIDEKQLNYYDTSEPFSYFTLNRTTPQTILIIENKDTFFSMRQHLLKGFNHILDRKIDTLIYGAGKRILSSFRDFNLSSEPYLQHDSNSFIYFGDLDYEGILIYQQLARIPAGVEIEPFTEAYETMLRKVSDYDELPVSKEQQNHNISDMFFGFFSDKATQQMKKILEAGRYIPQEALTINDF